MIFKVPEIEGAVCEDTEDGHSEAVVEAGQSVFFEDFTAAVDESVELSFGCAFADICAESGSGEVERVDEDEGEGACDTAGEEGPEEILGSVFFGVDSLEEDLVEEVLGGEVDGLGGEVSHYVGPVASPQRSHAFFSGAPRETVNDAGVGSFCKSGVVLLGLEQKFDSFDGSGESLGDGAGGTTEDEVFEDLSVSALGVAGWVMGGVQEAGGACAMIYQIKY